MSSAASSAANASSIIHTVRRMDWENSGMSRMRIPSARNRWNVVRKFTDPRVTAATNSISPRMVAVAPTCGVYAGTFSGMYIVQPPDSELPMKNDTATISPENRYSQYDSAFSRGNARSSAPICSGTK
jgi:hypothetical protein